MPGYRYSGSLFRKTFLSYTAILIIPILIFCAINLAKNMSEEQREMHGKHEADARRIAEAADNKLKELKRIGEVFADEAWVKKLMLEANVYEGEFDLLKDLEMRKDLLNAATGPGILSFAAILYPGKSRVVSPWGNFDDDYFFDAVASLTPGSRDALFAEAVEYQIFKVMPQVEIQVWDQPRSVIPVLQSLELVNRPRAVLALFIDSSYLASYLRQYVGGTGPAELAVTDHGSAVFASGPVLGQREAETFVHTSQVSEWKYVLTYANERVIDIHSMLASLIAALVSIVVGTVSAYMFAKVSYRPLGVLLGKLASVVKVDPARDGAGRLSEYRLIEKSIDRLLSENESLQHTLTEYKSTARFNMLLRLLKGYFQDEHQTTRMNELGLRYTDEMHYCTLLIDFHAVYVGLDRETIKKIEIITFMVAEKTMGRRQLDYQLFEVTNVEKAVIVSSGQPFGDERVMSAIAEEMMEEIRQSCGIRPEVLCGTIERGLLGISKSYYTASQRLHHLLFSKRHPQDVEEGSPSLEYYYPTDWEVQLINNLKIGNLDTWVQIVDEIRAENVRRELSGSGVAKLVSSLMETMLRVLHELNIDADLYAKQFASKSREGNADELWGYVYEVGTLICERVRYANTSTEMELGSRLLQYINQHYTSPDMSLKKLAELFHMSVSGVSKTFKEVTGINFYDYLCRLRMERAKELLRERKSEVAQIAQLVGYEHAYSFKRAFVRYVGIKPDEYMQLSG
ncbi:helix-turn-helix transcriptional regulator [Paenibacillus sp. HJGM_3]|uniref:helix-turn-helix transcriptional regulator n=1 Tax=Paenibacillus sp. HJGM_3 TaxID=3379816 RepID=UPI0038581382